MIKTTRLKRPQVPKPEEMFPFDNLTDRPKYGGVEMTHETDIPHADTLRQEAAALVITEANARDDADDALQAQIDDNRQGILDEADARIAADGNLQSEIDAIVASSDVKDIVGTKADLNNYDTSTLGNNDIIKVLQDESQNDETTYYRWSTSTETFSLIGAEGPYYTKSAADEKFQEKLIASTNINIAADGKTISATDTTYTAGTGLSLNGTQFSVDTSAIQEKLIAGTNVTIGADGKTISATDTTYSNFTGTDGTAAGAAGLVPAPATTDAGKYLKADGTWATVGTGPTVVQTTGTSTTSVMSQRAATGMMFADPATTKKIKIGNSATVNSDDSIVIGASAQDTTNGSSIAIGPYAKAWSVYGMAIGQNAQAGTTNGQANSRLSAVAIGSAAHAEARNSVGIGYGSLATVQGEMNIGEQYGTGYNNSVYRLLTGLYDPQTAHDAATKGYVDGLVGDVAAALNAINNGSN